MRDLFTKIEFSRRTSSGNAVVESVSERIMRLYRMAPLIVSHYDVVTALKQKINALAQRKVVQARDIFDLYILSTQYLPRENKGLNTDAAHIKIACENLFSISFNQFRDTVINYLAEDDQTAYNNPDVWDEIKLKVNNLLCLNQRQ